MSWVQSVSKAELLSACPELAGIRPADQLHVDALIERVRVVKATELRWIESQDRYFPDPGNSEPQGFEKVEVKDFTKPEIVAFDSYRSQYWTQVKEELRQLVCTNNRKYAKVRTSLRSHAAKGNQAAVAIVAASIGQSLGVAVGIIAAFVAIGLFALVQLGVNAFCELLAKPERGGRTGEP